MTVLNTVEITRLEENLRYQERSLQRAKENVEHYEKQISEAQRKLQAAKDDAGVYRERIKRWVAALRSGKYTQGRNKLHTSNDGYCCLGVACDISKLGHWEQRSIGEDPVYVIRNADGTKAEESSGILLNKVRDFYGLADANPVVSATGHVQASDANDNQGWSFERIADEIEARYLSVPSDEANADDEEDDD